MSNSVLLMTPDTNSHCDTKDLTAILGTHDFQIDLLVVLHVLMRKIQTCFVTESVVFQLPYFSALF